MASEITYAEVKFKNESPAPVVKVPPETKKPEHHAQKYPFWLPWLISLLLLLVCFALVVTLLVLLFWHSSDQPRALQQQFSEWKCDSAVPQGTGRGWMCCPEGWRRFQRSCYFLSLARMKWAESEQNCTGMGSHLVMINSKAEQEFLSEQIKQPPKRKNFYIGLFVDKEGQWHWADKTPYDGTAAFWRKGEPNNGLDENCTGMYGPANPANNGNAVPSSRTNLYRICEAAAVIV